MIDIYTVAKAARLGDALAIRLVEQLIRYLGAAVVNLVNLFDPDCVFLGRRVANATADLILDPIRAMVAERSISVAAQQVQIRLATFGNDEPVLGAACLVLHKLFSEPERLLAPLANKVLVQGVQ
jgi:glucokinase